MERSSLMHDTIQKLQQLPNTKLEEINDYVNFLLAKIDDNILQEGIQKLSSESEALSFLAEEDDLYTVNDLKVRYK